MEQIVAKLAALPKRVRRSATGDNSGEWARHERLRDPLGMRTHFCGPHSPPAARRHRERERRPAP